MDKYLYPKHPVRCIITGPSNVGKSCFSTNLILYIINEHDKIHDNIYSPSLHHDLHQKLIKCFSNYILIHIFQNNSNAEDIDVVIDNIVTNKDFQKSDRK